jgi:hypothetical protein
MRQPSRRYVLLFGVVLAVILAGCAGGGGTPTPTPEGDVADGGDNTGDGSAGDASATATPTPTATTTPTPTATTTPTPTPNTSSTATTQLPTLGDAIEPADSFRYRFDIDRFDGQSVDIIQEGRYYQGDVYAEWMTEQGTSYFYVVDGQGYSVSGDVCRETQAGAAQNPDNTSSPNSWANLSLMPTETTTLDGQEVYVYESENGPPGFSGPTTIYVSIESNHVVRQESPDFVSETWDFGNVDPVEAPC